MPSRLVSAVFFCENRRTKLQTNARLAAQLSINLSMISRLALVWPLVMLSGCTAFEDFIDPEPQSNKAVVVPLDRRPVEEPISRNYFVLETPEQSVIGVPQIVLTRKEDTLSDLAREYGLGYDEIIAANPDVDPWQPGDKTPVLLPTQYVVPDVPRTGIVLFYHLMLLFHILLT